MVEPEEDEDLFDDEPTPYKCGSHLLDELASGIPSKYVFDEVIQIALPLTKSQNAFERKAGVTAFGIMAEGCHERMRDSLPDVVPLLLHASGDVHTQVRSAANIALAYCAEYLQPEIYEYHSTIIPHIVRSLDDPTFEVLEKVCYTLDAFCRYMSESVQPFMDEIMTKLLKSLMNGDKRRQETMVMAVSAMASATEKAFLPYAHTVLQMMNQIMSSHTDDLLTLRGKATECVGIIAAGIGKEHFAKFYDPFMNLVLSMVKQSEEHEELREYAYTFFENIAHTLGEDFRVYLSTVMQLLSHCLSSEETALEQIMLKSGVEGSSMYSGNNIIQASEEEDISAQDTDSDEEQEGYQPVRTSMVEERASAISAVGAIAKACKSHFLPYLPQTLDMLIEDADYFHHLVRRPVMIALSGLMAVVVNPEQTKSDPNFRLNQEQAIVVDKILKVYIATLSDDEDKETVAFACEAVSLLCVTYGMPVLRDHINPLMTALDTLLQQKAPSNSKPLDEDDDHDLVLIDVVSDAIDDIARIMGADFAVYLKGLMPTLLDYTRPNRAVGDRVMALGTLAEVSKAMGPAIAPFVPQFFNLLMTELKEPNQNILRNAVYGIGVLCFSLKQQMEP